MELMKLMGLGLRTEKRLNGVWRLFCAVSRMRIRFFISDAAILLLPQPTDVNAPSLPATSHLRVQVERTRLELLKWIGKRCLAICQERAFDPLEGWVLKEISDHIEVPIENLLNPVTHPPHQTAHSRHSPKIQQGTTSLLRPTSHHPHTSKVDVKSMRLAAQWKSSHASKLRVKSKLTMGSGLGISYNNMYGHNRPPLENGHQDDLERHQHQEDDILDIAHHHYPSSMPPLSLAPLSSTTSPSPSTPLSPHANDAGFDRLILTLAY